MLIGATIAASCSCLGFAAGVRPAGTQAATAGGPRSAPPAQRVHGVVAAGAMGQVGRIALAFKPSLAGTVQARPALLRRDGLLVHAVEPQHVETHVEVQRAAKVLDQGCRAALSAGLTRRRGQQGKTLACGAADPRLNLHAPHEMAQKHAAFWDARSIQEFWTGHSFLRPDDSNLLSYGPVERLTQPSGQDATRYAALLRNADANDGGIRARHDAFGLQAGDLAEQLPGPGPWEPTPSSGAAVEAQAVSRARELAPTLPPLDEAEDLPR